MTGRCASGERADVCFGHVDQRANDRVPAVVGQQLRAHRLEGADVELVEQRVSMKSSRVVAEGELVAAELVSQSVEHPAAQAAQKAQ